MSTDRRAIPGGGDRFFVATFRKLLQKSGHPRRRGVSVVEMLIACAMTLIILFATYDLYLQTRSMYEHPRASFSVQQDIMHAARWLKRDLLETNVVTIRSFPATNKTDPASLSLESPRTMDENQQLTIGKYGIVVWQKYVYYRLVSNASSPGTASLIRDEGPLNDQPEPLDPQHLIPMASGIAAFQAPGVTGRRRVIATNLVPGAGFRVWWGQNNAFVASLPQLPGTGAPVFVQLVFADRNAATGQSTSVVYDLDVTPQN
jgi:hypothetical protein